MARNTTPDVRALAAAGDAKRLVRLLNHSDRSLGVRAAQALGGMELNDKLRAKAKKRLAKVITAAKGKPLPAGFVTFADPAGIAMLRQSEVLLSEGPDREKIAPIYSIWLDAYGTLLDQHEAHHGGVFRMSQGQDRARSARVEQVGDRAVALAGEAAKVIASRIDQFGFVGATARFLDRLWGLRGTHLTDSGPEAQLDFDRSRTVYQGLCRALDSATGLAFGTDRARWSGLAANMGGAVAEAVTQRSPGSFLNARPLSTTELKALAARTDLPAPLPFFGSH
jgi:hypothetical protein